MIINIRGTGGAGKSHLVRTVMSRYDSQNPAFQEKRKRPISYLCFKADHRPLFVPGHYETPTGGCDTISKPDDVFTLVERGVQTQCDVLFEGIMIGDDVRRTVELNRSEKVIVIALSTPLQECLAGIQSRRDTRGDDRPLNPKNTTSRADRLKRSIMPRLKDAGIETHWLSRQEALDFIVERLGV